MQIVSGIERGRADKCFFKAKQLHKKNHTKLLSVCYGGYPSDAAASIEGGRERGGGDGHVAYGESISACAILFDAKHKLNMRARLRGNRRG